MAPVVWIVFHHYSITLTIIYIKSHKKCFSFYTLYITRYTSSLRSEIWSELSFFLVISIFLIILALFDTLKRQVWRQAKRNLQNIKIIDFSVYTWQKSIFRYFSSFVIQITQITKIIDKSKSFKSLVESIAKASALSCELEATNSICLSI